MQKGPFRGPLGPSKVKRATQLSEDEAAALRKVSSQVTVDPALLKLGLTSTAAITVKDHVQEGKRDTWEHFKKDKLENQRGEEKARIEYRKQLDAERSKRLELAGKKKNKKSKSKKKKDRKKEKKKKKKSKKRKRGTGSSSSDQGSTDDDTDDTRKRRKSQSSRKKKRKKSGKTSRSPSPVQLSSFFNKGSDSSDTSRS
mmetsp:Transcript_3768/g.4552  ORF Transcript_3768/g.4552 Transcript_3768/m.4552 type:complete len:199 (+) Transcript_3768:267-863(+)